MNRKRIALALGLVLASPMSMAAVSDAEFQALKDSIAALTQKLDRGSVLLAYLMHAAFNTWANVFSIQTSTNHFQDWMMTVVMVLLAAIVVAASGAEHLSRTNARVQE